MKALLAAIELVTVTTNNSVAFQPGQLTVEILNAATSGATVVAAVIVLWVAISWMFRFARLGVSHEEYYDYQDDNPWHAGNGGVFMPAEYGGAIAYGATVIPGEREVTVHALIDGESEDIRMGRGDYERWFGLVDHEETQGSEKF